MTEVEELERRFVVAANQHYNSFGEVFQTKLFPVKVSRFARELAQMVRNKQLAINDGYREITRFAEDEFNRLYPLD